MPHTPAVSVLLPVYNTEKYLPRCLDALLGQTMTDFEILAVNDGSKDGSLALLRAYAAKDPRIRVFDRPNGGLAAVRSFGIKEARGRYFMTCDSDDWVEPVWIETLYNAVADGRADLAVCNCVIETEDGRHGRDTGAVRYNYTHCNGRMRFEEARERVNCLLWNKIFDLARVRAQGMDFPVGREHDDAAFMAQYLTGQGTAVALRGKRLYHYMLRGDSMMGNLFHRRRAGHEYDQLHAWRFVYDWLIRRDLWPAQAETALSNLHNALFFCWSCLQTPPEKEGMLALAAGMLSDVSFPPHVRVSPLVRAVKENNLSAVRYLLDAGDEAVTPLRLCGLRVGRRVRAWASDKIFVLGAEVYRRTFGAGGERRRILGIPCTRKISHKAESCK